jgi:hypothetical protein
VTGVALLVMGGSFILAVSGAFLLRVFLAFIGISIFYLLIQFIVLNTLSGINAWIGAILANLPVLLIFSLGATGVPVLGGGVGQLAAMLYVGIALLIAGIRGDPGCEVMSLPNLLFRRPSHLACLVFSPIDWIEARFFHR